MKTLSEIISEKLWTDATPMDLAPDELACSETVTTILQEYLAQKSIHFPIIVGTRELILELFRRDDLFERLPEPVTGIQAGDIIISPTGSNDSHKLRYGHTGFFINDNEIVSNSSRVETLGKFIKNFSRTTWRNYYHEYGGFPTYVFRVKI